MTSSTTVPDVIDALWLRRWAFELLSGAEPAPELSERVNHSAASTVRLFFEVERCAIALHAAIAAGTRLESLAGELRAVLDHYRIRELKRAMSARAQLQHLAELARQETVRLVVLKGGVAIADERYVDVADVDVLTDPEYASRLADLLEEVNAYVAYEVDEPIGSRAGYHLAQRRVPNAVQVEIHFAIYGLGDGRALVDRAEPIDSVPGLYRLCTEDHLFHLLHHACCQHPNRASCLRDLLLVADAVHSQGEFEARTVANRVAAIPGGDSARNMLACAETFRRQNAGRDRFTVEAAANYLLWSTARHQRLDLGAWLVESVFHLIHGPAAYTRWQWNNVSANPVPSQYKVFRQVARWSPHLSQWMRSAARVSAAFAALPAAVTFARQATQVAAQFECETV